MVIETIPNSFHKAADTPSLDLSYDDNINKLFAGSDFGSESFVTKLEFNSIPDFEDSVSSEHAPVNLVINEDNAVPIFRYLERYVKVDKSETRAFSCIESITIMDIGAAAKLFALIIDIFQLSDKSVRNKTKTFLPDNQPFPNLSTVTFGPDLVRRIIDGGESIQNLLQHLGSVLQPTHICLQTPTKTTITYDDFNNRVSDRYSDSRLLENLYGFMKNSPLESITSHGIFLYDEDRIPNTVKNLKIYFEDCQGSHFNPNLCTCYYNLSDVLDFIFNPKTGIDTFILNKKLQLVNLPHISSDFITDMNIIDLLVKSHSGDHDDPNLDYSFQDIHKVWGKASKWFKTNFAIINKDDAEACICCGSK